jgi:hypothetical protein
MILSSGAGLVKIVGPECRVTYIRLCAAGEPLAVKRSSRVICNRAGA